MTPGHEHALLHFTHLRNLPSILDEGFMVSDAQMQARGGVPAECGDRNIKAERRTRKIRVAPHGAPADYVPFYFAPRSPMLYVINKGRVATYQDGQPPLIYLATTVGSVVATGRPFVFSDGNCAAVITDHSNDLAEIDKFVDWPLMRAPRWANTTEDGDRMRRRMAEFLVHEHLPLAAIEGFGTYDERATNSVRALLAERGLATPVTVRRDWYY
ncbi:DUF4433 domain-containing protein [Streptacidiphilus sp. P02-A3a]|uniref:type II toxin-antitoxin system toxin DNA ADP-ribosyl transferase DarT n=1 Tax=Streptacidiphilus sp. P02-A3a TaxID=2704468 RepID=UPI0015F7D476|nr:DUF4433 domain-containing protein [Streptacidiphilus sp. P02-A3a]QMU72577.1 DUF4433 domain-containing protein [Streptacidiphilus sp. P02-A3a]